jgi:hypothetical protein
LLITGITSYGLAGIFSGANNFEDVTNDAAFESMCAITESEFRVAIRATRPLDMQMSEALMDTMKFEYNGYSWNLDRSLAKNAALISVPFSWPSIARRENRRRLGPDELRVSHDKISDAPFDQRRGAHRGGS